MTKLYPDNSEVYVGLDPDYTKVCRKCDPLGIELQDHMTKEHEELWPDG